MFIVMEISDEVRKQLIFKLAGLQGYRDCYEDEDGCLAGYIKANRSFCPDIPRELSNYDNDNDIQDIINILSDGDKKRYIDELLNILGKVNPIPHAVYEELIAIISAKPNQKFIALCMSKGWLSYTGKLLSKNT